MANHWVQMLEKIRKGKQMSGSIRKKKRQDFCQSWQHKRANLFNRDFFPKIDNKNHLQVYKINLNPLRLQNLGFLYH